MNPSTLLHLLRAWDQRRPSLPGEHWVTLLMGLRLLTGRHGLLTKAAGAALVWRAVSGRDGLVAVLRREGLDVAGRRTTRVDGRVVASAAEVEGAPTAMGDSRRTDREDLRREMAMVR